MTKTFRRALLKISIFIAIIIGAIYLNMGNHSFYQNELYSIPSPDGRYSLLVTGSRGVHLGMPGSGSDRPGYVWLLDKEKRKLAHAELEMVQDIVGAVEWTPTQVHLKLIADWDLPK